MTLEPFQYSLGGVVWGRNTDIPVNKVEIQPYNVNVQDFQVSRTDERRFGLDTLAPGSIVFQMSVMDNSPMESMVGLTGEDITDELLVGMNTKLPALAKIWKTREVRMIWGQTIPLLCCDRNGVTRQIYGRPGKFAHTARTNRNTNWIDVQAEFRRADTFAHNDIEYFVGPLGPGDPAEELWHDDDSDADSWLRILIEGPATHPMVTLGGNLIELNYTIPAGQLVEISSYPWMRRVVDSNGVNLRRKIMGSTRYLDQITFPAGGPIEVSWTATSTTPESKLHVLWREAYNVF